MWSAASDVSWPHHTRSPLVQSRRWRSPPLVLRALGRRLTQRRRRQPGPGRSGRPMSRGPPRRLSARTVSSRRSEGRAQTNDRHHSQRSPPRPVPEPSGTRLHARNVRSARRHADRASRRRHVVHVLADVVAGDPFADRLRAVTKYVSRTARRASDGVPPRPSDRTSSRASGVCRTGMARTSCVAAARCRRQR